MESRQREDVNHPQIARSPFQYSLRTLLVVTTIFAVACALLLAAPGWVRLLSGLCCVVTFAAVLATVLVYGRGYARTFCIGALFPAAWAMFSLGFTFLPYTIVLLAQDFDLDDCNQAGGFVGTFVVISSAVSLVVGLLAMLVRRLIEGPSRCRQPAAALRAETSQPSDAEPSTSGQP